MVSSVAQNGNMLSRSDCVGLDSDYKGFMEPASQHLLHSSVQPSVDTAKMQDSASINAMYVTDWSSGLVKCFHHLSI